jgi:hypothetical protein
MRKWLEESEKAGDFVIYDAELRRQFWLSVEQERPEPFVIEKPTGHEFDEPWWRKGSDTK